MQIQLEKRIFNENAPFDLLSSFQIFVHFIAGKKVGLISGS